MIIISFTFTSNDFDYAVLTGTKANPVLLSKNSILLPANHKIPETTGWFETQLELLLNTIKPNMVCYKLTINHVTYDYITNVYYGQAVLNLLCNKKAIQILHTSPASIIPSKFNQPKNTDLYEYLEALLGKQPSPWNKGMKDTILIGLINLV